MKKKFGIVVALSVIGVSSLAADTNSTQEPYTHQKRIIDMQMMAQAMIDIETGFFYNNNDIVQSGAKLLQETVQRIGPTVEEINNKDIYEQFLLNGEKFTLKIKKKIKRRAKEIAQRFASGDAIQALQAYSSIAKQCMKCHVRLRKW